MSNNNQQPRLCLVSPSSPSYFCNVQIFIALFATVRELNLRGSPNIQCEIEKKGTGYVHEFPYTLADKGNTFLYKGTQGDLLYMTIIIVMLLHTILYTYFSRKKVCILHITKRT